MVNVTALVNVIITFFDSSVNQVILSGPLARNSSFGFGIRFLVTLFVGVAFSCIMLI